VHGGRISTINNRRNLMAYRTTTAMRFPAPFFVLLWLPVVLGLHSESDNNFFSERFLDPRATVENITDLRAPQQGNCPATFHTCTPIGRPGSCCYENTNCVFDEMGELACCPTNTVCHSPNEQDGAGGATIFTSEARVRVADGRKIGWTAGVVLGAFGWGNCRRGRWW